MQTHYQPHHPLDCSRNGTQLGRWIRRFPKKSISMKMRATKKRNTTLAWHLIRKHGRS